MTINTVDYFDSASGPNWPVEKIPAHIRFSFFGGYAPRGQSAMQGPHQYQLEPLSRIDYEALIPKNHLLRKIDEVLDLSFLRDLTAPLYANEINLGCDRTLVARLAGPRSRITARYATVLF